MSSSFAPPIQAKDMMNNNNSNLRATSSDDRKKTSRMNFGMGGLVAALGVTDTVLSGVGRSLTGGLIHGTGLMMASVLNENGHEGLGTMVGLGVSGSLARTMLRASRPLPMLMAGLGLIGLANNARYLFKLPELSARAPSVALTTVSCHM